MATILLRSSRGTQNRLQFVLQHGKVAVDKGRFVATAIMVLSYIYAGWGNLPIMVALFLGLKAAVLRRIPVRAAG